MILLIVALLAAPDPQWYRDPPARCRKPVVEKVTAADTPRVRKLGEMPPAKQMLTVLREVDRCPRPVVLRDNVGAASIR